MTKKEIADFVKKQYPKSRRDNKGGGWNTGRHIPSFISDDDAKNMAEAYSEYSAPRVKKNPVPRDFSIGELVNVIDRNDKKIRGVIAYARDGKYRVKDEDGNAMENNHFISGYRISGRKAGVKKNPIIPGITARPVKAGRKPVFAVEHAKAKTGPWSTAGLFPNRTLASDYAQAMHAGNSGKWWRVVLK